MEELLLGALALALVLAPLVALGLSLQLRGEVRRLRAELERLRAGGVAGPTADGAGGLGEPSAPGVRDPAATPVDAEPPDGAPAPVIARTSAEDVAALPAAAPATPRARAPGGAGARGGLESFLGGRVLLVVGVIAVLLALAFFFKLAVDRGWIGPAARIGLGVVAGVAALAGGDRLRARGYGAFGQALMGAGLGALFLCCFVSALRYAFLERSTALVLSGGLAGLGAGLAVWRGGPLLAWLGFLGGYAAPALLGRHEDALASLTAWLALLGLGLAAVLVRRPWRGLNLLGVLVSLLYLAGWRRSWFEEAHAARAAVALIALLAVLLVLTWLPAWLGRRRLATASGLAAALAWAGVLAQAQVMFWPEHRLALAGGCLAVGAAAWGLARAQARRHGEPAVDVGLLDGLALATAVVAAAEVLEGDGLSFAWAALGVLAVLGGAWGGRPVHQLGGLAVLALGGVRVLARGLPRHESAGWALLNGRFLADAAPLIGLLLAAWSLERGACLARGADAARAAGPSPGERAWLACAAAVRLAGSWGLGALLAVEVHEQVVLHGPGGAASERLALAWTVGVLAAWSALVAWCWGRRDAQAGNHPAGPLLAAALLGSVLLAVPEVRGFTPGLNAVAAAGLAGALAALLVARATHDPLRRVAWILAGAWLLAAVTRDVFQWGEVRALDAVDPSQARFRAQVLVSAVWTSYGALLLVGGFRRGWPALRQAGLGVLLLTVGKVFLFDLSNLDTASRVGSFLVLGLLLLGASFLYQRHRGDGDG